MLNLEFNTGTANFSPLCVSTTTYVTPGFNVSLTTLISLPPSLIIPPETALATPTVKLGSGIASVKGLGFLSA